MGLIAKYDGYNIRVYENNNLVANIEKDHWYGKYQEAFKDEIKDKNTAE
jgi:hypothetical protein